MDPLERISENFKQTMELALKAGEILGPKIVQASETMTSCLLNERKILSCGNGGSAAEAQRFSGLMLNRFNMERPGLPAIALTTDTSTITSIANDYQYADIFSKQIEALGKKKDIAWGMSTSGNSKNVLQAIEVANEKELYSIAFTGRGGPLATCGRLVFTTPSDDTARIQEAHITLGHILCDLVERTLFP